MNDFLVKNLIVKETTLTHELGASKQCS